MPHTSTVNFIAGIYRSDCCGIEQAVADNYNFPPCRGGKLGCEGNHSNWTLVRKAETKEKVKSSGATTGQPPAILIH